MIITKFPSACTTCGRAVQPGEGPLAPATANELADLAFEIAGLEDAAQNAEDREQLGRASAIRAKIRPIRARIAAIVAARAVQS